MNSQISKDIHVTKDGDKKNHQAFAMELSRLRKAKELCETNNGCEEFNKMGGRKRFQEVENLVKTAKEANRKPKEVSKNAGAENQFIKTHEKKDKNPTAVGGIPKITGKSIYKSVMSGKATYNESLEKEISNIRYLIEYMTNNKKQNL